MDVTKRIRRRAVAVPLVEMPRLGLDRCESGGFSPAGTAVEVNAVFRVPPKHLHTEGKTILRADFEKLRAG